MNGYTARYSSLQIILHWATLALIIAIYTAILWRGELPKEDPLRGPLLDWHRQLALVVFALVWIRLLMRWLLPSPAVQPPPPSWQRATARLVHILLYLFLIVMPVLGVLMTDAAGRTVTFFGMPLPNLIGPNKDLGGAIHEIHETIGNIGYALIGVHAAAALYHHFLRRDTTFRHMLPGGGSAH